MTTSGRNDYSIPRTWEAQALTEVKQIFFGGCEIEFLHGEENFRIIKSLKDGMVFMEYEFWVMEDGEPVSINFPAHFFIKMERTEFNASTKAPACFLFELAKAGLEAFEKLTPGMVEKVKEFHNEKELEFPKHMFFVLNPSDICMTEQRRIVYRGSFSEMIYVFTETYATAWAEHNKEQPDVLVYVKNGEVILTGLHTFSPIETITHEEFTKFFMSYGLRIGKSEEESTERRRPKIRIFIPKRESPKKKMKRRSNNTRRQRNPRAGARSADLDEEEQNNEVDAPEDHEDHDVEHEEEEEEADKDQEVQEMEDELKRQKLASSPEIDEPMDVEEPEEEQPSSSGAVAGPSAEQPKKNKRKRRSRAPFTKRKSTNKKK